MPDLNADPRFARFGLRTECPRCGAHLPVNGPAPSVDCADCGYTTPLPNDLLFDLLRDFNEAFPKPHPAGTAMVGDITWRWTAAAIDAPTCSSCDAPLSETVVADEIVCGTCQTANPCPQLPAVLRKKFKAATRVLGGALDLSRPEVHIQPVALACPQCGAGLTVAVDRARITPCEACGSQIHLPDAVWRALHPPRKVREWVVRYEGQSPAAARARTRAKKAEIRRQQREAKAKKNAAKEAKRAEAAQAAREKAEEKAEARREQDLAAALGARWRLVFGTLGVLFAGAVSLGACATMGLTLLAYALPTVFAQAGLQGIGPLLLTQALLGVGLLGYVFAWFVAVVAAAARGKVPILGALARCLPYLLATAIPLLGVLLGPAFAAMLTLGHFPTPSGQTWKNYRLPLGAGWPLAVLLLVGGPFCTIALAATTGMTVMEMIDALPED